MSAPWWILNEDGESERVDVGLDEVQRERLEWLRAREVELARRERAVAGEERSLRQRQRELLLSVVVYGGFLLFLTVTLCLSAARWGSLGTRPAGSIPPGPAIGIER